jgi:hypothetical protein
VILIGMCEVRSPLFIPTHLSLSQGFPTLKDTTSFPLAEFVVGDTPTRRAVVRKLSFSEIGAAQHTACQCSRLKNRLECRLYIRTVGIGRPFQLPTEDISLPCLQTASFSTHVTPFTAKNLLSGVGRLQLRL